MAFTKTSLGKAACATGPTVAGMGGLGGQIGGTLGGGLVRAYTGATGTGTLLASWTLPALTDSTNGLITMTGTAPVATPGNAGTATSYTLCTSGGGSLGTGTITATGGGGDMTLNNINLVTTSDVTLTTFTHQEN
jgi:hypothetical protein